MLTYAFCSALLPRTPWPRWVRAGLGGALSIALRGWQAACLLLPVSTADSLQPCEQRQRALQRHRGADAPDAGPARVGSAAGSGPQRLAGAGRPRAGGLGSRGGLPVSAASPPAPSPFQDVLGTRALRRGPLQGGGSQEGGCSQASGRCRGQRALPRLLTACSLPRQMDVRGWGAGGRPVQASVRVLRGPRPHGGPGAGGAQHLARLHHPR